MLKIIISDFAPIYMAMCAGQFHYPREPPCCIQCNKFNKRNNSRQVKKKEKRLEPPNVSQRLIEPKIAFGGG